MSDSSKQSRVMRYARRLYIIPFLVNLALIFSSSALLTFIGGNGLEETVFPLPCMFFYATLGVCAPASVAACRILPDPSLPLFLGGLLTSAGLLWTGLEDGLLQYLSFSIISAAGISLSFQATCIAISPYFIREKVSSAIVMIMLSTIIMAMYPLVTNEIELSNRILFILSPIVFISSVIPFLYRVYTLCGQLRSTSKAPIPNRLTDILSVEPSIHEDVVDLILKEEDAADHHSEAPTYWENSQKCIAFLLSKEGWTTTILSALVWLSWGAGVGTTHIYILLPPGVGTVGMTWRHRYSKPVTDLAALQLLLSFILLAIKLGPVCRLPLGSLYRTNLASNYMHLGLLGAAGLILCHFQWTNQAVHNYFLFTAGFALQFDDLCDLHLVLHDRPGLNSVRRYKLIQYDVGLDAGADRQKCIAPGTFFAFACHIISILLLSLLGILLGIHIANLVVFLTTVPPLSFLCTLPGLALISVAAVCTSLMKPDTWMDRDNHILVME